MMKSTRISMIIFMGSIAESAGKNPLEFGTQWVVGPVPWEDLHRFGLAFSEAWGNDPSPSGVGV